MEEVSNKSGFEEFMKDISTNTIEYKPTPASTYMDKRASTRKMEFSKKILVYAAIVNTLVILVTLYIVVKTYNVQPLVYLIPSVAAEVASGTVYYYKKSEREAQIKLFISYGIPITENIVTAMLRK